MSAPGAGEAAPGAGRADPAGGATAGVGLAAALARWEGGGDRLRCGDHQVWYRVLPAAAPSGAPPLLALHGFPTCSYDWVPVLDRLRARRDVVVTDAPGFGLSDKPDRRYGIRLAADGAEAVIRHLGLGEIDLLTHDMGDTVGGELLARALDGDLALGVRRRVVANGSIYLDLAQLTDGQHLLLSLPDAAEPAVGADGGASFRRGVHATFAPGAPDEDPVLDAVTALAARAGGLALLPRTIRYIEDRRAEEARFTGAIERHPSPVALVWGDRDPVAVHAMTDRFLDRRPDAVRTTLDGVGHYPMVEAPDRFAEAVLAHLDA